MTRIYLQVKENSPLFHISRKFAGFHTANVRLALPDTS